MSLDVRIEYWRQTWSDGEVRWWVQLSTDHGSYLIDTPQGDGREIRSFAREVAKTLGCPCRRIADVDLSKGARSDCSSRRVGADRAS